MIAQGATTQVPFDRILPVNLVASTVVFFTAARIYALPRLGVWGFRAAMPPIRCLHCPCGPIICFDSLSFEPAGFRQWLYYVKVDDLDTALEQGPSVALRHGAGT